MSEWWGRAQRVCPYGRAGSRINSSHRGGWSWEHNTVWELPWQGLQVNLCNAGVCTEPAIPQNTWSYIGHNKRSKWHRWYQRKDGGEPLKRCPVPKRGCNRVGTIRAAKERTSASAASQSTSTGSSEMKLAETSSDYSLQAQRRPKLTVEIIVCYFGQQGWDE